MAEPVTLVVQPRGKPIRKLPADTTIALSDSTAELYKRIAAASATSVHRLRIAKGSDGSVVPNSTSTLVQDTGLRQKSVITVKDLGPQIAWRTVFLVEYAGPLLIHPLIYCLRPYLYPYPSLSPTALPEPTSLQKLSLAMVTVHFLKRELETLFVHRFSNATMPAFNIFKNSGHYWLLSGLNLAVFAYGSSKTEISSNPLAVYAAIALFVAGELANLNAHLGLGFNWVTCPNYLFEIVSWTGVWIVNSLISKSGFFSTALFVLVAGVQMALWAAKKERRYRKEFGPQYKRKKFVMIPGLF
ncbi:steroid alpha reductase family protein [Macrophomina phaseolina]|uniref:Steroid alpha reductase family protein n=1 Tax=Macrophomina phaseolina TaxID=35725 RepID=A0ABQ8GY14_9PEZI|nr:steroid alpha reductase family protein [Macrophomina phaseolina]